jgi:cytochrome c oxidase assembly protein subunit 11
MIPVLMFGFGFALVPLYDVFCDITGLNGKTGRIEASEVDASRVDTSRTIEVRFLANTNTGLPWDFKPLVKKMEIHPGQVYEAVFQVRSASDEVTLGQAVGMFLFYPAGAGCTRDARHAAAIRSRYRHLGKY